MDVAGGRMGCRSAPQVLVYVRESEKVGVDEVLMERLQKEVAQLRAMIVRLKDNQANGASK